MTGVNQEAAIIPVKVSPVMILNHHCGMVFSILSIHHHKEYTLFHSGFSLQAEILTYPGLTHNDPGFQMNRNHFGPWSIFSNLKRPSALMVIGPPLLNWAAPAKQIIILGWYSSSTFCTSAQQIVSPVMYKDGSVFDSSRNPDTGPIFCPILPVPC
jgi:hypothetical protein